jgi:hypothetical protein
MAQKGYFSDDLDFRAGPSRFGSADSGQIRPSPRIIAIYRQEVRPLTDKERRKACRRFALGGA